MFRFFETRVEPFPETRSERPPKGLFSFTWHYMGEAWPWLLVMAGLNAIIAVGEVALYGMVGEIVDWLNTADPETFLDNDMGRLWIIGGLLIGLVAATFAISLVMFQALFGNLPMTARWRMHRYLLRQSMQFYADEFAGRVSTKVMQTALALREAIMKVLDVLVYVGVYFLAMLTAVALADWRLMVPMLVWFAGYVVILWYFVPRLAKISEIQADARSEMTGRIVDSYTNISTVKLFAHAGREERYARDSMDQFLGTVHPQMRLVTGFYVSVYTNNILLIGLISGLGLYFWQTGAITVGALAVAIPLALRINSMSTWIMWEVSALFENVGTIYDGMSMMRKRQLVTDRDGAPDLAVARGEIAFEAVSFHYGKGAGVIEGLDLGIAPGEKVGLVGRSGAGKSTLVNLLLRFYDVESGRIAIDGVDISGVTQDSLRGAIGMVTQDTSLLHRSIRENVAYGRPEASDEDVRAALARADALSFIDTLEDAKGRRGLDAQVGERGVKLSGGQRQRIAIARVFLKDAPILVLDEATSALDSEVEAAIQGHLFELMEGKTVIAIAHRLSTIAAMDRLIVLDQGRIIEQGPHETLIRSGGLYADLWARQSGGFLGEDVVA